MRLFIKSFHESSHKEWNDFMWVLDTLYSLLRNWLRDHTSWTSSGIGVKIKSLPKNFWSSVLNFIAPRYAFLFSNFETYIAHVIIFKWSRSVNFSLRACIFSNKIVLEWSSFRICITCFVSFGIRDNSFISLEDYAFNFLHGCWNYVLIKIEIAIMMLFKFEFKYVKLIFKAIASMKFSFDIILWLSCLYVSCLFKKNRRKLPSKISGNSSFTSFDQLSETLIRLFK